MLDEILAPSMEMWKSGAKFAEGLEYMHDHARDITCLLTDIHGLLAGLCLDPAQRTVGPSGD